MCWIKLECELRHILKACLRLNCTTILSGNGTSLEPLIITLNMIGKFGITGSFGIVFLYAPEIFPTTLRLGFIFKIKSIVNLEYTISTELRIKVWSAWFAYKLWDFFFPQSTSNGNIICGRTIRKHVGSIFKLSGKMINRKKNDFLKTTNAQKD